MKIRVTDILGKEVYTTKAIYVGKIYDVMIDQKKGAVSGLVLKDAHKGCLKDIVPDSMKKVVIPYHLVHAIGNIVLIKPPTISNIQ
ncbi:PRC-barrel domain-containing protein [Methanocaldococcus infernus]|uniref:PRC-barrel domain protein n=1 Tax=Methanocaldococcus infernus (strain DSM 11812 / JCM 15783 / ME) TaxID=573063 RepID=D5VQL9_METIM|nr:PRC-barrel domain-containing protein [Methanocaldococcus infernus]ADG12872.1 PRC-barrel domain protein [Methanocaldococcus infernus ME]